MGVMSLVILIRVFYFSAMYQYHDTTDVKGQALDQYEDKATTQGQKVLFFMRAFPGHAFSPEQVHDVLFGPAVPLTSTRRAMSNLTRDGLIVKTAEQVIGQYGRPVCKWRAVMTVKQLNLFP